jgi:hypothetical protein
MSSFCLECGRPVSLEGLCFDCSRNRNIKREEIKTKNLEFRKGKKALRFERKMNKVFKVLPQKEPEKREVRQVHCVCCNEPLEPYEIFFIEGEYKHIVCESCGNQINTLLEIVFDENSTNEERKSAEIAAMSKLSMKWGETL